MAGNSKTTTGTSRTTKRATTNKRKMHDTAEEMRSRPRWRR